MTHFSLNLSVYYEDTDAGGVVYYANYLKYMERARTEWLRALAFPPSRLAQEYAILFVVRSVALDYLQPARLDDALRIEAEVSELRRASLSFRQRVVRLADERPLAKGHIRAACLRTEDMRPTAMPADLLEAMQRVL